MKFKSIEENWYIFLNKILKENKVHVKDDGDKLLESMVNHCLISNPLEKYAPMSINNQMFLDLISKGEFDIKGYPLKGDALRDYVASFDDPKQIHLYQEYGEVFIYTYPERIENIKLANREGYTGHYNQYRIMKKRLMEHDGSNRAVATTYSAGLDENEQHIPCLQILQATIRDDELLLHVFFRSNDCYGAFPSNMLFLSYIGLCLVEDLKPVYPLLKFKGISYNSSSLHIYESDLEQAKKLCDCDE